MRRPCLFRGCCEVSERSYCPHHATVQGKMRDHARAANEPWRKVYTTKRWVKARAKVKARDKVCKALVNGIECGASPIEVHHIIPLKRLWEECRGWNESFINAATHEATLIALCSTHHKILEKLER